MNLPAALSFLAYYFFAILTRSDAFFFYFLRSPHHHLQGGSSSEQCDDLNSYNMDSNACSSALSSRPPQMPPFIKSGIVNEITDIDVLHEHFHDASEETLSSTVAEFLERLPRTGYDSRVRPFVNGKRVMVSCSMYIGGISSVSETNMDFTADLYFRQVWDDHRVRWNPAEMDDHEDISIGGDFIEFLWRPDTYIPNAKVANYHQVTRHNAFVRIMPHGHVKQSMRITVTAQCPMDFRLYPMDQQKCVIILESFSLPATDLVYIWRHTSDSLTDAGHSKNLPPIAVGADTNTLPQFIIRGFRAIETVFDRNDGTGNYSRLVVEFYFSRSLGFYMIQVYLPASLVVGISWISFWISRHSQPARVLLSVTTVLALTLMSNQDLSTLPKISYLKALDLFMIFCFAMVFMALIEFAIVSYAIKRVRHRNGSPIKRSVNQEGELLQTPRVIASGPLFFGAPIVIRKQSYLQKIIAEALQLDTGNEGNNNNNNDNDDCNEDEASTFSWPSDSSDEERLWTFAFPPSLPSRIEWLSRFFFPFSFFVFNVVYWNYFLSQDTFHAVEEAPDFIKFTSQ